VFSVRYELKLRIGFSLQTVVVVAVVDDDELAPLRRSVCNMSCICCTKTFVTLFPAKNTMI
jgi:uncharacterized membrane protein